MRRFVLAAVAAVSLILGFGSAKAVPISSDSAFAIGGSMRCDAGTCEIPVSYFLWATGDFSQFAALDPVSAQTLVYAPFSSWEFSAQHGPATLSFYTSKMLFSQTTTHDSAFYLTAEFGGWLDLTGYDKTYGLLTLTSSQQGGAVGAFNTTSVPIPEPEPLLWLGVGLLGLGYVAHQRKLG